jgi:hypothetical protein
VNNKWEIYQFDEKAFMIENKVKIIEENKIPSLNVLSEEVSFFFNSILHSV